MTETLSISPDETYIRVHSSGSPSLDEMQQTLAEILELSHEYGINAVLVDSRGRSGQPPLTDIYSGGETLAETLGSQIRVAVLVKKLLDDHTFFENVAVNRGADLAYFEDEDAALSWLLQDES